MLANVYLLKYNNYFNRQVKRLETLEDYLPYFIHNPLVNCNFNPNDDVDTELIINYDGETPDYLLVFNAGESSYDAEPISRWYVMDATRTRKGQYRMTLKRDVLADHLDSILQAPCFVEKATLSQDNPLIFNSEGMTFNQIKQDEFLLKDETAAAWIVGYFANNYEGGDIAGSYKRDANITVENLSDWDFYQYTIGSVFKALNKVNMGVTFGLKNESTLLSFFYGRQTVTTDGGNEVVELNNPGPWYIDGGITEQHQLIPYGRPSDFRIALDNHLRLNSSYIIPKLGGAKNTMDSLNNKYIHVTSTNKYYKIVAIPSNAITEKVAYNKNTFAASVNDLAARITGITNSFVGTFDSDRDVFFNVEYIPYTIALVETSNIVGSFSGTFPAEFPTLNDAPYSMFCIPFAPQGFTVTKNNRNCTFDSNTAFSIANALAKQLGSNLYDIQLLPYCPLVEPIMDDGRMVIDYLGNTEYIEFTTDEFITLGYAFFAYNSSFSFNIPFTIAVNDKKIVHECEKWRLVSPNYASYNDFSPAMNDGVDFVHVNCTYKPYSPYINCHINYKGLYGQDYDDAKGLICGGDFSLPLINDAWTQYQIQNKNFQNIFDREQQHLEVLNKQEKIQSLAGIAGGAIQGASSGAIMGAAAGPYGAIAGAVGGAVISAGSGIADYAMLEARQKEQMGYNVDMFNYSLGNIQALPLALTKVGAFDINNKLWPFIEYYSCTTVEKDAFIQKLKYNGMTVMTIGKLQDFVRQEEDETYVQGQLIRLNVDDSHMVHTIYSEIAKGVFICQV